MRAWTAVVAAMVFGATPAFAEDLGTVESVDPQAGEVTLKNGKVLSLQPRLEVVRDDAVVTVEDLEPGDVVRASYGPTGTMKRLVAQSPEETPTPSHGWEAPKPN